MFLLIKTALIVLVLSKGWGLIALATVVATVGLLEMLGYTIAAFRLEPHLRFNPRLATRESITRS